MKRWEAVKLWRFAVALLLATIRTQAESIGYGELEEQWRGEIVQLSWSPRVFLAKAFLTDAECNHIINLSKDKLKESLVVDNTRGTYMKSDVRTSSGAQFGRGHDGVLKKIEARVASITMIPVEHQEGWQILHYTSGQKYDVHYDTFHDQVNQKREFGGQRVVTMLMYLSNPQEGGETVFPYAARKVYGPGWSECALQGLANKPVRGDALFFHSLKPDGTIDPASQHGSCPTLKGEKWSATKWIHVYPFGVATKAADPHGCGDQHEQCLEWAYFGECKKNPGYMLVSCKTSCKVPCGPQVAALQAA